MGIIHGDAVHQAAAADKHDKILEARRPRRPPGRTAVEDLEQPRALHLDRDCLSVIAQVKFGMVDVRNPVGRWRMPLMFSLLSPRRPRCRRGTASPARRRSKPLTCYCLWTMRCWPSSWRTTMNCRGAPWTGVQTVDRGQVVVIRGRTRKLLAVLLIMTHHLVGLGVAVPRDRVGVRVALMSAAAGAPETAGLCSDRRPRRGRQGENGDDAGGRELVCNTKRSRSRFCSSAASAQGKRRSEKAREPMYPTSVWSAPPRHDTLAQPITCSRQSRGSA